MGKTTITEDQRFLMKVLYTRGLLPCADIAERIGCSRQSVITILKKMGVDTSKRKLIVECNHCNSPTSKTRAEIRKHERHFCSSECYNAYLRRPDVIEENFKIKVARDKCSDYLPYGGHSVPAVHIAKDDIYIFADRAALLEWKRTGQPHSVTSVKNNKKIVVIYKREE